MSRPPRFRATLLTSAILLSAQPSPSAWSAPAACVPLKVGQDEVWTSAGKGASILATSPDGKFVVTQSNDAGRRLRNTQTGEEKLLEQPDGMPLGPQGGDGFFPYGTPVSFSKDGNWLLSIVRDGELTLHDLRTGREKKLPALPGYRGKLSPDGAKVVATSGNEARVLDVRQGTEKSAVGSSGGWGFEGIALSADGSRAAVMDWANSTVRVRDLNTSADREIRLPGRVQQSFASTDGSRMFVGTEKNGNFIVDIQSGAVQPIQFPGYDYALANQFSPDGKTLVLTASPKAATPPPKPKAKSAPVEGVGDYVTNGLTALTGVGMGMGMMAPLPTQGTLLVPVQGGAPRFFKGASGGWVTFSDDGSKVLLAKMQGNKTLVDLRTGKSQDFSRDALINSFSADGRYAAVVRTTEATEVSIFDTQTGNERRVARTNGFKAQISPDGKRVWINSPDEPLREVSVETTCVPTNVRVLASPNAAAGDCPKPAGVLTDQSTVNTVTAVNKRELCEKKFAAADWAKLAPDSPPNPISQEMAESYLLRFQKKGGFSIPQHLPTLVAILDSPLGHQHPELAQPALARIASQSLPLYEDLLSTYPWVRQARPGPHDPAPCLSAEEDAEMEQQANAVLKKLQAGAPPDATIDYWERLAPFKPWLSRLSKEKKDETLYQLSLALADSALRSGRFKDVFHSKLYKFAHHAFGPFFGENEKDITDVTLIRQDTGRGAPKSMVTFLMASQPIDGDDTTRTQYGFSAKTLDRVSVPRDAPVGRSITHGTAKWKVGGEEYTADYQATVAASIAKVVPDGPGPKYDELWADKKLTGLVVTGSNLRGDAVGTMDEYLAYYREKGFQFPDTPEVVADLHGFLKHGIQSGELDYFVKEAHSDGDEKNLVNLDKAGKLLKGVKKLPDGREEVINLVYPDENSRAKLVSNQDFASWIQARHGAGKGQFVYFNTSCWSATKAANEVEATGSETLLNIAATSTVHTFANQAQSSEQLLFSAFREGKSFAEMRTALEASPMYKDAHEDHFVFPDQEEYRTAITNSASTRLETTVQIHDSANRPYTIGVDPPAP